MTTPNAVLKTLKIKSSILTLVAFLALLTLFPGRAHAEPEDCYPVCPGCHIICLGFVNGWGLVTASQAGQPGAPYACDTSHQCQVTLQGSLTAETFFGAGGEIGEAQPFTIVETIDFPHPAPNGTGGFCYPVVADLTLTDTDDAQSTLAVHFLGQGCQVGSDASALTIAATYDFENTSTGRFTGVSGIGQFNLRAPTGTYAPGPLTNSTHFGYLVAFSGNMHFPNAPQLAARNGQSGDQQ